MVEFELCTVCSLKDSVLICLLVCAVTAANDVLAWVASVCGGAVLTTGSLKLNLTPTLADLLDCRAEAEVSP